MSNVTAHNQQIFYKEVNPLWLYLIEYIRVSRVEEVGQPLLDPFDHLRPHRVYQEIITRHGVSFVTEGRRNTSMLKISYWFILSSFIKGKLLLLDNKTFEGDQRETFM